MKNVPGLFALHRRCRWVLLYLLGGTLAACGGSGRDAAPTAVATAATEAHGVAAAMTTYSVVNLDPANSSVDPIINASNQVAFTGQRGVNYRAGFFDGDTIRPMGTFGGEDSFALALNDAGQVAGDATDASDIMAGFRWTATGGLVRLGTVSTTVETRTSAINRNGQIAGFASRLGTDDYMRAVLWSPAGAARDLGTLGGNWSLAMALNAAATVAGSSQLASGARHAFAWTGADGMVDLGTMGGSGSEARLINDAGRVAGLWSPTADDYPYRGFVWDRAFGMVDIGTLGGLTSFGRAINASGQVAGFADMACDACTHAVSWTRAGGLADLGTLGGTYADAFGINRSGQVVGWSQQDDAHFGAFHAFVWSAAQGMVDLNQLVPHVPAGLVLTSALAISDSGAIVADSNAGLVLLKPGTIGTNAPLVGPISPEGPVLVATQVQFAASFLDQDSADRHSATWSWNDGCGSANDVNKAQAGTPVRANHTFCRSGDFWVTLTVTDSSGRSTTVGRTVTVYDYFPAVAGSGWLMSPHGANRQDKLQSGRATFSFAATAAPPARKMTLRFKVGKLAFESSAYDALSVAAGRAEYRGSGTLNGAANYRFSLTVADGATKQGRLRMQIWHADARSGADVVDYDNQSGAVAAVAAEGSRIAGGSIVIRQ